MNLSKTQLLNHLEQFYGTQYYYPLWPKVFLTDGAQFLAQEAACYWLMDAIASHIVHLSKKPRSSPKIAFFKSPILRFIWCLLGAWERAGM